MTETKLCCVQNAVILHTTQFFVNVLCSECGYIEHIAVRRERVVFRIPLFCTQLLDCKIEWNTGMTQNELE